MSENIQKARALLAAATPEPWYTSERDCATFIYDAGRRAYVGSCLEASNGALIAAAPTIIATLCDEADALRAELEKERARVRRLEEKVAASMAGGRRECGQCGGSGYAYKDGRPSFPCAACDGSGAVIVEGAA